jgi:hypothetical protein
LALATSAWVRPKNWEATGHGSVEDDFLMVAAARVVAQENIVGRLASKALQLVACGHHTHDKGAAICRQCMAVSIPEEAT